MTTPLLGLSEIAEGVANQVPTHNLALRQWEARSVRALSMIVMAPPAAVEGDSYIVPAGATGAWSGKTGQIASFIGGAWSYCVPVEGIRLWINDLDAEYVYDGAAWIANGGDASGDIADAIAAHEAASNPHPGYLTQAEGDAAYDAAGAAAAAVAAHAAESNPHPIYLTQAEADALYAGVGASGAVASVNGLTGAVSLSIAGTVTPKPAHRYWRILVSTLAGPTYVTASTIQMRTISGGANVATGGTPIDGGGLGSGFEATRAFDTDVGTFWAADSTPGKSIGYDFGAGNEKSIVEVTWTPRSVGDYTQAIATGKVQYSDDGTTWVDSYSIAAATWTSNTQTQAFTDPNPGASLGGMTDSLIMAPTDGQVLRYDAAAGKWKNAAPSTGASSYRGAHLKITSDKSLPSVTTTAVTWDAAVMDTNSFWSAAAPKRLTIPAGVSKVRVQFSIQTGATASRRENWISKNGANFDGMPYVQVPPSSEAYEGLCNGSSAVVSVATGDYFEFNVYPNTATTSATANGRTWFAIEVIE